MAGRYLKQLSDFMGGLFVGESVPEPVSEDKSPVPSQESVNLADLMDAATEYFTHRNEFSRVKSDGRYELFDFDYNASFYILYQASRPSNGIAYSPEGTSSFTWAKGELKFTPDAGTDEFEDIIAEAARGHETDKLNVLDEDRRFPNSLAEFYVDPEQIERIPDIHEKAAMMAVDVYSAYVGSIIFDLEKAEHIQGALQKELYEGDDWNLTDEEWSYRKAVNNYSAEFPTLVSQAVHEGFLLSEEIYESSEGPD